MNSLMWSSEGICEIYQMLENEQKIAHYPAPSEVLFLFFLLFFRFSFSSSFVVRLYFFLASLTPFFID
nr:hypothetical protein BaRGS_025229 [Batillaria attramentaria]